jgi:hypothetical protein
VWLLALVLVVAGVAVARSGATRAAVLVAAGVADAVACVVCRRLQPVSYELDGSGLAIERRARSTRRYPGSVTSMPSARLGLRVAGSGGLYGYLGRFRLVGGGRVSAFVTDRSTTVIARVGDAVLAVSPADKAAFLNDPGVSGA